MRYMDLGQEWWDARTDQERNEWCTWFKRHGFDPNRVLVSGWAGPGMPVSGWVECDDDARTVATLVRVDHYAEPVTVQLESPALGFP